MANLIKIEDVIFIGEMIVLEVTTIKIIVETETITTKTTGTPDEVELNRMQKIFEQWLLQ